MARPVIHPGEILLEELTELGVTPTELSRQINVPPNRVTQRRLFATWKILSRAETIAEKACQTVPFLAQFPDD